MEFRLLGPLEVRSEGVPCLLGGTKQRALFALLLWTRIGWLRSAGWSTSCGGEPAGTAVATIQVYVSRLRKLFPEGTLVTRPPGYQLGVEPGTVDLQRFERLVAMLAGLSRAMVGAASGGAGIWRGPPLAEFAQEPFARVEAGRLEELRPAALELRVEADLAVGRHDEWWPSWRGWSGRILTVSGCTVC